MVKLSDDRKNLILTVDESRTVYLDHWAIRRFAEPANAVERKTLLSYLDSGGTLLFSYANLYDLAGHAPGNSREAMRSLFKAVNRNWAPIAIWPQDVTIREEQNNPGANRPCYDNSFMDGLVREFGHDLEKAEMLDSVIEALDRAGGEADSLRIQFLYRATELIKQFEEARDKRKTLPFKKGWRNTKNAFNGIINTLIVDGKPVEINDVNDILHATVPSVYVKHLLLDTHWATKVRQNLKFKELNVYSPKTIAAFLKAISE